MSGHYGQDKFTKQRNSYIFGRFLQIVFETMKKGVSIVNKINTIWQI